MKIPQLLRWSPTVLARSSFLWKSPTTPIVVIRATSSLAAATSQDPSSSSTSDSTNSNIQQTKHYEPPKVWDMKQMGEEALQSINRPTAGARHEQVLPPKGRHDLQLYSLATPNGQKVTILLEELLAQGYTNAEYDAWPIQIMEQDQFGSGFVKVNPNSKIPALLDYSSSSCSNDGGDGGTTKEPVRVFESGSILLYLAEKFDGAFLPPHLRTEVLNWLFWQTGSSPVLGGGFGHFYGFAKEKQEYPINRFTMETKRQLDVLNNQLKDQEFIAGNQYTIADISIFTWYGGLVLGDLPYGDAQTFLNVEKEYPNVIRWAKMISERPAVQRGRIVTKTFGDGPQLAERHDASDIDKALDAATDK